MRNELLAYTTQDSKLLNVDAYIDGITVYLDFENKEHIVRCYPGQSVHLYRLCLIALNLVRDHVEIYNEPINLKEITLEVFRAIKRDQVIKFEKMIREGSYEKK